MVSTEVSSLAAHNSSHGRSKASTMAHDATASRVVEAARSVGVLVPSCSVRDSGTTLLPFQQRRSHELDSSDPGGPRVWSRGLSGWMPGRHIRRGDDRRGREDTHYRCHDIVKFCGMARRTGGKERAHCGKPIEAIQALAEESVRMETIPEYALELERGEKMVSLVFCRPDQCSLHE
jgi:hypothetical protein